jgi:copper homeostasis protein
MILEACVENISEALKAESLGAGRIELCDNLHVGGTTPSSGTIRMAKHHLSIPIIVLIRPRGGNFVYSPVEVEVMKKDIEVCKQIGVFGVAIGALKNDHSIDIELVKELIALARPLQITFHKAIDETGDILREFKKLQGLGIDSVLTSGGKETALVGEEVINSMVRLSKDKLNIIAAGKITKSNLTPHIERIQAKEFHGKFIVGDLS